MPNYSGTQKEETFKAAVFRDFFSSSKYAYEPNIGNIDFIVTEAKTIKGNIWKRHYLWAESKKGVADIPSMLTQLVLTIKKTYEKGEHLPPPFIACFDTAKIAFVPFHDILPIFSDNDVNWNVTPSNHTTDDFLKTKKKVEKLSKKNIVIFNFETDKQEIVNFINKNLVAGNITSKFLVNKNNFVIIYGKWLDKVKKSIAIDWKALKNSEIIDGDFFLADLWSKDNYTLKDKLFVILMNNQYKFDKRFDNVGFSLYKEVGFNDSQKAHKEFWDKYERPPLEEYYDYIINRRDLLVPQDIRERKGSFFTPRQWVELSQKYIGDVFGEDWQDEYYVWDCAAGTGNLLAGLTNKYNIWASTLDTADVDVMKERIKNGANLLVDHVFQFDFLNDKFDKLPKVLKKIIDDPVKRKKLLIYINPPYAESSGGKDAKTGVSTLHRTKEQYQLLIGKATNEIFSQFLTRIYKEIPACNLAFFSKLKYINGSNFNKFRDLFCADYKKGFICKGNTFDNVTGEFPIGFSIWNLQGKCFPNKLKFEIFDNNVNKIGKKSFYNGNLYINKWFSHLDVPKESIGRLYYTSNDFQQSRLIFISMMETSSHLSYTNIGKNNLIECSIYFAVRVCIEPSWLNDRDQFLYPNDKYKDDIDFQNDCLAFTLFHSQNRITKEEGVNHWIPFSETEVNAKDNFESHFIFNFIHGKINGLHQEDLFERKKSTGHIALKFSDEAKAVFKAAKKLWKYYHAQPTANVNASFYDIRAFFQGRDDSGKMNNKSGDDTYITLIGDLRSALKTLALKIQPKVYEYGFLVE